MFFAEALAQNSSTMNGSFGIQSSCCFRKKPLTESKNRKPEQWTRRSFQKLLLQSQLLKTYMYDEQLMSG
jgi:hypothetical protein